MLSDFGQCWSQFRNSSPIEFSGNITFREENFWALSADRVRE